MVANPRTEHVSFAAFRDELRKYEVRGFLITAPHGLTVFLINDYCTKLFFHV